MKNKTFFLFLFNSKILYDHFVNCDEGNISGIKLLILHKQSLVLILKHRKIYVM